MSKFLAPFAVLLFLVAGISAQPSNAPLLIGRVAVNQTHIAFSYAGKIWLVERSGGIARKLNDASNEESFPV
ncbi:MAG TPA: hypothetical protein VEX64_10805 [Pyrinomonadaceae bacterium]|nr:hypothetical protein [Pyrinomonadaceae bacterium]